MLRSGMIYQNASGIYTYLPIAQRVIQKLEKIIEKCHDKVGAMRITMPTVQPASLWQESGRYEDYGKEMLRITDRHDRALLYGPTHEEVVVDLVRQHLKSYKQLQLTHDMSHCPLTLYQIHWKFRDEIRPRFGVMRGREFLMKDAYSFDLDEASARVTYEKMFNCYLDIFASMGLEAVPLKADSGPIGGDLSHEFHVIAKTGESAIYFDKAMLELPPSKRSMKTLSKFYAVSDDQYQEATCPVPKERLMMYRGIEVGHIFYFGDKYSNPMNVRVSGANGEMITPQMGSYGIGVTRLLGAIIEANHDEEGIIWPKEVAPFSVGLLNLKKEHTPLADELYDLLINAQIACLYDDRNERGGVQFTTMDMLGMPYQVIVGARAQEGIFEIKNRKTQERVFLNKEEVVRFLKENL